MNLAEHGMGQEMPPAFLKMVCDLVVKLFPQHRHLSGHYLAKLLWQRGWYDCTLLSGWLDPSYYTPTSAFDFGEEMKRAIARLRSAYEHQEKVVIWGDFDVDGLTATAVLWDGLVQFFPDDQQLTYVIPNRLTQSHGLNRTGLMQLAQDGCHLMVTCGAGSNKIAIEEELAYAQTLGIDIIVTGPHALSSERPVGVAFISPYLLPPDHSFACLPGVAVAYKLVEALYETLPHVPQQPLEHLLDLVAIGTMTDIVELKGDSRYLAQRGVQMLQILLKQHSPRRPGIAHLLKLCQQTGDRPTDRSFGIGPRLHAISQIQGDASFTIELLTSRNGDRCRQLAEQTELAHRRCKALQKDIMTQVVTRVAALDLSTTSVIVLADPQWSLEILGLVAGQIAQIYHRPTILLATASVPKPTLVYPNRPKHSVQDARQKQIAQKNYNSPPFAIGVARSAQNVNLYALVQNQSHLLHHFGGHPLAASLSLPVENIALFSDAINRECLAQYGFCANDSVMDTADLTVTVAELGQRLFRELKLLEPFSIMNPVPRLLIQQCEFKRRSNRNIQDLRGGKLRYIKTEFLICDASCPDGFPGVWWGHYHDELPHECCDAIVELDFTSNSAGSRYEVRLLELQPIVSNQAIGDLSPAKLLPRSVLNLLDQRHLPLPEAEIELDTLDTRIERIEPSVSLSLSLPSSSSLSPSLSRLPSLSSLSPPSTSITALSHCPHHWSELEQWVHDSLDQWDQEKIGRDQSLVLTFALPIPSPPVVIWQHLVGVAKYLSRTAIPITQNQLCDRLGVSDRTLTWGLQALEVVGFVVETHPLGLVIRFLRTTVSDGDISDTNAFGSGTTDNARDSSSHSQRLVVQSFLNAIQEEQFQQRYFACVPVDVLTENLNRR